MTKYRNKLPQTNGNLFITDGGLETTLIFHNEIDLPYFAAFDLLKDEAGIKAIENYYRTYMDIALRDKRGFVLESCTWRASSDWGEKLGYTRETLADANRKSIWLLENLREENETATTPMVLSGCIGPRGDGYDAGDLMTEAQAQAYHAQQIDVFADTAADLVTGVTMTNAPESIGIVKAAQQAQIPAVISFTVETDGNLPAGDSLGDAIRAVDAATDNGPAYFMINCAHPTHFDGSLPGDEDWVQRIAGLRTNASKRSHAELDEAEDLDDGNPVELGDLHGQLRRRFGQISVMGGCCGTDHRHIAEMSRACR
ncbi:MAG: homocysteine S-methyltransferase family protein [Methyloligellaceae bacterium]